MGEDKVAGFGHLVAAKARFEQRLLSRFAVVEFSEPPTACRRVFSVDTAHADIFSER
jgi:hypothetical protein